MTPSDPNPDAGSPAATTIEAAVFRRLLHHLQQERPDVQNIDLMILAGFCRNCLADWYRDAAGEQGLSITRDQARERIYGMPFPDWKALHQVPATPAQLTAFEAAQSRTAPVDPGDQAPAQKRS